MEHSQAWTAVCLALVCLIPWGSTFPLSPYQPSAVPGYSGAYPGYSPYFYPPGNQPVAYQYVPGPSSKSAATKETQPTRFGDVNGLNNHGYFVAQMPATQYRTPDGASPGQLPSGVQYLYYPAGAEYFRQDRPTLLETFQNFISGLRPGNRPERPDRPNRPVNFLNPFTWFGNQENNNENAPIQPISGMEVGTVGGGSPGHEEAKPEVSNEVVPQSVEAAEEKPAEEKPAEEKPAEAAEEKPAEEYVVAENSEGQNEEPADEDEPHIELETIPGASVIVPVAEEAEAQAAEIAARILERSRYLPVVGIPRNRPNRRMATAEGGSAGAGGAAPAGEEDVGEQEEDEEDGDSVVIGVGGSNPSVAQAKPQAIALAGVGGVAAAAPSATAVVGANGLAVSAPSATAIAGPSAGAPPPGLLPKVPTQRVPGHKVSAEEARRNAAMIAAARQQAQMFASGLGSLRSSGYPSLPYTAFQVWNGGEYGLN